MIKKSKGIKKKKKKEKSGWGKICIVSYVQVKTNCILSGHQAKSLHSHEQQRWSKGYVGGK